MKLPMFRSQRSVVKRADAQDHLEKLLAESLRLFGNLCGKLADVIETQRLERTGYPDQDAILKRLDRPEDPKPKR